MLANANPQMDSIPASRKAREIVAVCAKHGVPYGESDNLASFLRALNENKHLAMNFWSVVARMTEKEAVGETNPNWLLEAIIEGVTGRTVAEINTVGPAYRMLVKKLASILAGEDVHISSAEMPFPPARVTDATEFRPRQDKFADAARLSRAMPPLAPTPKAAAPTSTPPQSTLTPIRDGNRDEKLRLVLDPEPSPALPAESKLPDEEDDRRIVIPLSGYAEEAPKAIMSGRVLTGALVLSLIAVFGFLIAESRNSPVWERFGASIHAGYTSAVAAWNGQRAPTSVPADRNPTPPAAQSSAVMPAPTTASTTPTKPTPRPFIGRAANAVIRAAQAQREAKDQPPAIGSRVSQDNPPAESSASDNAVPEAIQDGRVTVPGTLMNENLISSRVPVYPDSARAANIQGNVVLQAIITKEGVVGHLHVISGNSELRRTAMEAVSSWRYRPYLVNGQPVDVSTTISVDFSPNQ
jgi:TonB family protein